MRSFYLSITLIFTRTGDGLVTRWRWQIPHLLLHLADHRYRLRREHPHCSEMQRRQEMQAGPCCTHMAHGDTRRQQGESSRETQISIHVRLFLGSPCSLPHILSFHYHALASIPSASPSSSSPTENDDTGQPRFPSLQRNPVPNIVIHQTSKSRTPS